MHKIAELQHVDFETFHNIVAPANKPALLLSLVQEWLAIGQCRGPAAATCGYLERLDNGKPVYTIAAPPAARGRFFYSDDLRGVNFKRGQIPFAQVLAQLLTQDDKPDGHFIAVQALSIRETLPEFENENRVSLIDASVPPTMWKRSF